MRTALARFAGPVSTELLLAHLRAQRTDLLPTGPALQQRLVRLNAVRPALLEPVDFLERLIANGLLAQHVSASALANLK